MQVTGVADSGPRSGNEWKGKRIGKYRKSEIPRPSAEGTVCDWMDTVR